MKVLIYGAGAVGLGLSSCLMKSGQHVTLIGKENTVDSLRKNGLVRTGIFGDFKADPENFSCYTSLNEVAGGTFDIILVSVKSFDSKTAARDLRAHTRFFNEETIIILCQNGWGNADKFIEHFSGKQIYNARIITGFTRGEPNEVEITVHADCIRMGSLFGGDIASLKDICEAITKGGIPCEATGEIGKDLWAKMLYNCALNPLGAVLDVPYGVLGESDFSKSLMDSVIREAFEVMQAADYKTHWQTADEYLNVFYTKLLPSTAGHKSSTLQSLAAKKPTEIEALNGAILRLADRFNIPIAANRTVYKIVKFMELKNIIQG